MHYVVKEGISPDLVADADSLMREFYRADKTINNLDQNNIKSASINFGTSFSPANPDTCRRACTRTHTDDASSVLYKDLASPTLTVDVWGYTSPLTFNLAVGTPFSIYVSGQASGANASRGPMRWELKIMLNGEILGVSTGASSASGSNQGTVPATVQRSHLFISENVLLPAGDCSLYVGILNRQTQNAFGLAASTISGLNIAAIGYAR